MRIEKLSVEIICFIDLSFLACRVYVGAADLKVNMVKATFLKVKAGDFVLIYIMFYLFLWPSHSLKAYEDAVLHEFLHVRCPNKTENWIDQRTSELLRK